MRVTRAVMKRQVFAAAVLSALAVAAMAAAGRADAADLSAEQAGVAQRISACGQPQEEIVLFDERGHPTIPARTPYYFCVTGTTLVPGEIPPPPEYCCH